MLPEVICLTHTNNMRRVNTDMVYPDIVCLLIVFVDRGPKKIFGNFKCLCKELPAPLNSLNLKVVTEAEVTEHLKECTVTCGMTYSFKVGCTDTLLAGSNSVSGGNYLTCEELLHRRHT